MSPVRVKTPRRRAQLSCDRCRLIKRKCDRSSPCNRCVEDNESCTFDRARLTQEALQERKKTTTSHTSQHSTSGSSNSTPNSQIVSLVSSSQSNAPRYKNKTTSITSSNPEALHRLVAHPIFLERIVSIYFREIAWFNDILTGSRLHRLVNERQDPSNTWPGLWEELQILAIAVTAVVAQTCPSDVEAVLVALPPDARQAFCMAETLSKSAYDVATDMTAALVVSAQPQTWPAEIHASAIFLRICDKNRGLSSNVGEKILIDITRMQKAKLHQRNLYKASHGQSSVDTRTWQAEHDLLAYRVFWQYLFEDRVVTMLHGTSFSIQARHCNICLRDPFGHITIQDLCRDDVNGGNMEDCRCMNSQDDACLGVFAGAVTRISVINGRYFERLITARSPSFRWPEGAEQIAAELELDLLSFEADLSTFIAQDPHCLHPGQEDILALYIARVRRDVAKQLCDGFAASLLQSAVIQHTVDPLAVQWLLQRGKLDSAKALITRVMEMPRRLSIRTAFNYFFLTKFIYQQTIELLEGAEGWLQWVQSSRTEESDSICGNYQRYYVDCIRLALAGRNLLVLSSRQSELYAAKQLTRNVVDKCADVLRAFVSKDLDLGSDSRIVDDAAVLNSLEAHLSKLPVVVAGAKKQHSSADESAPLFSAAPTTNMDEMLMSLFVDLPALEQLFSSGYSLPMGEMIPV